MAQKQTVGICERNAMTEEHHDQQEGKLLWKSPFVRQYWTVLDWFGRGRLELAETLRIHSGSSSSPRKENIERAWAVV